jgi:hypothetical protein
MTTAIFLMAGCEQFSTSYQRIDDTEFRLLDFIFEPADVSPGDTVTLMAVFAGKTVDIDKYIDWWISYNVVRDLLFGAATVLDSSRLEKYLFDTVQFSGATQSVAFKIPIPKDIMRKSRQIPDRWTDMLPPSVAGTIPAEFASMTKNQIIDTLESFLENPDGVLDGSSLSTQSADYLPRLLQIFAVPIRVAAKIEESGRLPHAIHSYQTIRYNRRLDSAGVRGIPINRNPSIDSVVVYKVEGGEDIQSFNTKSGRKYTAKRLDNSADPVIEIESGYSYFLEAFSDNSIDTSLTTSGAPAVEKHYAYWQFGLNREEAGGVHHSEYMDIGKVTRGGPSKLTPPSNRNIKRFTLWVTVNDEVIGELNRPEASTLKEISGRFTYR